MANTIISGVTVEQARGVVICFFSGITASGYGTWQSLAQFPDKTVQVYGTFSGSSSISIRGSNDPAQPAASGGNAFILTSVCGAALTFTTTGSKQILENPKWLQFHETGAMTGAGVTANIQILCQSLKR